MATNTVKVKSGTVIKPGSTTPVPQPASGLAGLGANAIKTNQSVPKPATTPSTSTSNAIPQPTSTVKNAATSPGTAPSTGYGGATYGTDAATNRAIEANQAKIQNDPAFRQSEIERTLQVIAERQAKGLDTSAQYKYLTQNLGYNLGVSNQIPQPTTSTVKNAATSSGPAPSLGYGGATYGTDAATNRAIEANQAKIQNDPAFRQSEIERTLAVIAQRKAQGMDTSEQMKYLTVNLGYKPQESSQIPQPTIPQPAIPQPAPQQPTSVPNPGVFVPPTPTQQIPVQKPDESKNPVMDRDAIEKYAQQQIQARLDAMKLAYEQAKKQAETDASQQSKRLADQLAGAIADLERNKAAAEAEIRTAMEQAINSSRTSAEQAISGITTSYERARQNIGENRAVEDVTNARRLSPFSGRSDYALGMIEQERARTDREMLEDYNSRIGNINQDLANYIAAINQDAAARIGNLNQQLADRMGALTRENQTRLQEIQENLANFRRQIDEKWTLAQTLAPAERDALIREIMQDERNYELMLRGEFRSDVLANSQLNNDAFMRALEAYNANRRSYENDRDYNRSVFESDRNFERRVYEDDRNFNWGQYLDVVDRTGNINPNVLNVPAVQSASANPYAQLLTTGGSQRTLQGQAMDLQNKQANLEAALAVGEASGRLVSPQGDWGGLFRQATNPNTPLNLAGRQFQANEQQRAFQNEMERQRFHENVRQFGLEYAARQAGLSLEQARLELARDDNARQWAALDWQMRQAEQQRQQQQNQYSGASLNQIVDSLRPLYWEPIYSTNSLGEQVRSGEQLTKNTAKREELFLRIASLGLPYDMENQAMLLMGLTPEEISLFDRKYGFNQ